MRLPDRGSAVDHAPVMEPAAAARAVLDRIPGVRFGTPRREDLTELAEFFALCEEYDANPERQSLPGLEEYWDADRSRPEEDLLLGRDDRRDGRGRIVAVGWSACNRSRTERRGANLTGMVHPERRREGIGRAVMAWQIAHARAWDAATREAGFGPLVIRAYVPTEQADVRDLAERHGLVLARYFVEMTRPLTSIPDHSPPDGIRIVDWDPARSREVHRALDSAFAGHWGHADRTEEMWDEAIASHAFRPEWSLLAVDEADVVVAAALNCAYEQDWTEDRREGYTDELGVLAPYRGRGIARALLVGSMRRFSGAGLDAAALGVDVRNPSSALGLYEALGYRTSEGTCVHELIE